MRVKELPEFAGVLVCAVNGHQHIDVLTIIGQWQKESRVCPTAMRRIKNDQVKQRSALGDALPIMMVDQATIFGRLEIKRSEARQFFSVNAGYSGATEAITKTRWIGYHIRQHDTGQHANKVQGLDIGAARRETFAAFPLPVVENLNEIRVEWIAELQLQARKA